QADTVTLEQRVTPAIPIEPRFVLDVHLGRLAAYLRMLGFDTLYENHCDDDVLARISSEQARILLTRDVGLLKRGVVVYGYFVRATQPEAQLAEVARRYRLLGLIQPFARCLRCNGLLAPAPKAEVADVLPPNVRDDYEEFRRCQACEQVYWRGTHYQRMQRVIARLANRVN
ncbi:MAG TPA: Mut7-C RNAse domain-containing protein, partial [Ktedonobacterales bacterium]|nr:Mut7-C RNAse domain-containing protein [Ktedonobacterales bacterium]